MKHLGVDDEGQVRVGGAAAEPHEGGTLGKAETQDPKITDILQNNRQLQLLHH